MNMKHGSRDRARRRGQSMVELALILVLIALAAILTLGTVGDQVTLTFQDIQQALSNPNDPGASSPYTCPNGTTAVLHGHKYHCQ